ncbi:hypothetical protein CHARACLAT_006260, partial [Characodon lateralis]|nr:hypothetical protein [Characodon lateralis]
MLSADYHSIQRAPGMDLRASVEFLISLTSDVAEDGGIQTHAVMTNTSDLEKLAEIELQREEEEDEEEQKRVPDGSSSTFNPDPSHPYYDVARHGIIQVSGDDNYGRKLIVFSSCCLPPSHQLNHRRLLEYLKFTLDQYVEMDYILVYFHYGLRSSNKPSLKWLREAYSEFDRKYKKNLKTLYVVHPTNFIRIIWNLFKPLI